ncbi:MAG: ParB N-terminal domain-containing protein [Anaerolineales bacterium]|jgi:hypothetical protein
MDPLPELPDLRIVESERLQPHEEIDASRLGPLMQAIEQDGILRNPPVVAELRGAQERFVVLDGANRTVALRNMGVAHTLVQVVNPQQDSIQLRTWNQVVQSGKPSALLKVVQSIPDISINENDYESALEKLRAGLLLAFLGLPGTKIWEISGHTGSLPERIQKMAELISAAESLAPLERTGQTAVSDLQAFFPDMAGLLVLHNFVVEEVMVASAKGMCLPSGITRFVVSPRALRINFPLDRLTEDVPRQVKQAHLDEWVKRQLKNRSVRYYAESTFLFDE